MPDLFPEFPAFLLREEAPCCVVRKTGRGGNDAHQVRIANAALRRMVIFETSINDGKKFHDWPIQRPTSQCVSPK